MFVADSLSIPTRVQTFVSQVYAYDVEADGNHLQIPIRIASDPKTLGDLLGAFKEALDSFELRKKRSESLGILKNKLVDTVNQDELKVIELTLETLIGLSEKNLDSIWIFVMRNLYAPIVLMGRKIRSISR